MATQDPIGPMITYDIHRQPAGYVFGLKHLTEQECRAVALASFKTLRLLRGDKATVPVPNVSMPRESDNGG